MIKPQRVKPNSPFQIGKLAKIILFPFGLLYRLWLYSIRFEFPFIHEKELIVQLDEPVVIVLWHNRLFLAGEWQRRFRKGIKCFGLISQSRDGAWLETFYSWSGIHAVRGSSNRGGAKAIRDLTKKLREGSDIGITPDGSKGPKYQAKPGGLYIAKLAKAPIALLSFEYGRHFKLKSWDQFIIPLPFSRVLVRAKILHTKDIFENSTIEEANEILNTNLMNITND